MFSINNDSTIYTHEMRDTDVTDGLICNPSPFTLTEWPDGTNTYLQGTLSTDTWAGWVSVNGTATVPVSNGNIALNCTVAGSFLNKVMVIASPATTVRIKARLTSATTQKLRIQNYPVAGQNSSNDLTTDWQIFDFTISGTADSLRVNPSATAVGVLEIDWIYIGDGSYTSKALDASGNGNNASVYGATPINLAGKPRGLSFDGVNDYTEVTVSGTAKSISLWFKAVVGVAGEIDYLISNSNGTNLLNYLYTCVGDNTGTYADESFSIAIYDSSGTIKLTAYVRKGHDYYKDGLWHHFAANFHGTNKIYIDGIEQTLSYTFGSASTDASTTLNKVRLARSNLAVSSDPSISDPRIYNRALTEVEIKKLYKMGAS